MRLGDLDELYKQLDERAIDYSLLDECSEAIIREDMAVVVEQPTIDAVPVVRCKDCKHYRKRDKSYVYDDDTCDILYYVDGSHRTACEEDFCSYGERKDGEG